eukprot:SAG25_NODE_13802_length_262_cov_1.595092_1_plen_87_part_11
MHMQLVMDAWIRKHRQLMTARKRAVAKTLSNVLYYFDTWAGVCAAIEADTLEQIALFDKVRKPKKLLHHFSAWMSVVEHNKFVIMSA